MAKEIKENNRRKEKIKVALALVILSLCTIGIFSNFSSEGFDSITMRALKDSSSIKIDPNTKVVPVPGKSGTNALFDVILDIPEGSKEISPEEDLIFSIELINFGTGNQTDVFITYIITNKEGKIILIQHEEKTVYTQDQFLKTIDIPRLIPGKHQIFVEMLYSNTSATATGEFYSMLF